MIKKVMLVVLCLTSVLVASGCGVGMKSSDSDVKEIRFKDMMSIDELKKYDGKQVSITGFMATISPLEGQYVYLQNIPYQNCPFCKPNTNELVNTMAVHAPDGKPFDFMDVPVKMTGMLEMGNFKDDLGYTYQYRIIDAKAEKADIKGYEDDIAKYTALVDKGFAMTFNEMVNELFATVNYEQSGLKVEELKPLDESKLNEMEKMFDGLDKKDYKEVVDALKQLKSVVKSVNKDLADGNYTNIPYHGADSQLAYDKFYAWLIKPEI